MEADGKDVVMEMMFGEGEEVGCIRFDEINAISRDSVRVICAEVFSRRECLDDVNSCSRCKGILTV